MILVNMCITNCVHEFARFQITNMCYHVSQQGVACNVEWNAKTLETDLIEKLNYFYHIDIQYLLIVDRVGMTILHSKHKIALNNDMVVEPFEEDL